MMIIELRGLLWKESTTDRPQIVLLKGRNERFHANFIHNHSVIVHTIGSPDRDVFSFGNVVEILDFFVEKLHEVFVKHIKRIDTIDFFFQYIWNYFIGVCIIGSLGEGIGDFHKVLVKPGMIKLALKKLRVLAKGLVEWFRS